MAYVAGEVVAAILILVSASGGPIFSWTVVFAPIAIAAELTRGLRFVLAYVDGPLVLGPYALAATAYPRWYVWTAMACFYLACFVVVCWLRDVTWWPWE